MKLLGSNILIKRLPAEVSLRRRSFLELPDSFKWDSFECEVLAVGPGELMPNGAVEEIAVKPGDHVVVAQGQEENAKLPDGSFIVDISICEALISED